MTGASPSTGSARHLVLTVMTVVVLIALGTLGYIVSKENHPLFRPVRP